MESNEETIQLIRKFAATRKIPEVGEEALHQAIDRGVLILLQESLPTTLRLCRRLVSASSGFGRRLVFECQRALARAGHMGAKYKEAESAYLKARALVLKDPDPRARIDRALIDVYMYLGDFNESRRRANMATRTFRRLESSSEVAKTNVNYANVLHRQDRHKEAEKLYKSAADHFTAAGDELSAARCFYNRANTLVQLFFFSEAEILYSRSSSIYEKYGYTKDATDSEWGLAWMYMLKGNFHVALKKLNACELSYRRMDVSIRIASCELDRAEVYLQLNLNDDAFNSARRAEKLFKKLGVSYEAAKAALYGAYAALAMGRRRQAINGATRAKSAFAKGGNSFFVGAAELLEAKTVSDSSRRKEIIKRASKRFEDNQLPLWQAICDINSLNDAALSTEAIRRLSENPAVEEIPTVFAAYHVALGDSKAAEADLSSATSHWIKAADRLDAVKSALPPVELRSSFGKNVHSPHLRLVSSKSKSDPLMAAVWSERYKTSGLWAPTASVSKESGKRAEVERQLSELSQCVLNISKSSVDSDSRFTISNSNLREFNKLRRKIRQSFIILEDSDASQAWSQDSIVRQFRKVSQSIPIIQYHIGPIDITCFVHSDKETRTHTIRNGREKLSNLSAKWSFLLENSAMIGKSFSTKEEKHEKKIFDELGELFWIPLEIQSSCEEVLVIPEGQLSTIPWAAIKVNGCSLLDRHRVVLSPSLRHFVNAQKVKSQSTDVAVFIGDTSGLSLANREREMIRERFSERAEVIDPCHRDSWPESGSWDIWHYTGHAHLNVQNPFYSSLTLEDGALFAADLRLRRVKLNLATIAACHSGTEVALPGEESTGFVRSFLEMGSRNVLAGHWSVSDSSTVEWMSVFYENYKTGEKILKSAQFAAKHVRDRYPSAYYWAVFSVFGAGS